MATTSNHDTMTLDQRYERVLEQLSEIDQAHVFTFWSDLNDPEKEHLLEQVADVDWPEVARLVETHVKQAPAPDLPEQIDPAPYYPNDPGGAYAGKYAEARAAGEALIRAGKVAAFTVAGGQGTRLGWDAPKGTFPATPVRGMPLFGVFAEYLLKVQAKYRATVPWYVMTSPINHVPTVEFLEEHNYFGLNADDVMCFPQAMMPAFGNAGELRGKALLADKHSLALSPNGHGGSLKALWTSGAIDAMKSRGVEQISYVQVDNPLVKVVDPLFLGLHALDEAEMSSKMLPKREPLERVGNFVTVDGRVRVIEYTNLPDDLAHEEDAEGNLKINAGSIAIHAIRVDFIESLNTAPGGFALPWNRANKKVPYLDPATGNRIDPREPNAVKLETFVFDALPMAETSIVYETVREEEFGPIKNADGEGVLDSPATSKRLQVERAARWLEQAGAKIPRDAEGRCAATIELPHTTAVEPGDLKAIDLPDTIGSGDSVLIQ